MDCKPCLQFVIYLSIKQDWFRHRISRVRVLWVDLKITQFVFPLYVEKILKYIWYISRIDWLRKFRVWICFLKHTFAASCYQTLFEPGLRVLGESKVLSILFAFSEKLFNGICKLGRTLWMEDFGLVLVCVLVPGLRARSGYLEKCSLFISISDFRHVLKGDYL